MVAGAFVSIYWCPSCNVVLDLSVPDSRVLSVDHGRNISWQCLFIHSRNEIMMHRSPAFAGQQMQPCCLNSLSIVQKFLVDNGSISNKFLCSDLQEYHYYSNMYSVDILLHVISYYLGLSAMTNPVPYNSHGNTATLASARHLL